MPATSRRWCGTLNNYTLSEYSKLWRVVTNCSKISTWSKNGNTEGVSSRQSRVSTDTEKVRFATWQLEEGDSGTPHVQLYIELTTRRTRDGLLALLNEHRAGWSVRIAQGSAEENIVYTSKDRQHGHAAVCRGDCSLLGLPCTGRVGTPFAQGKRSDLESIKDEIASGCTEDDLIENHFGQWVRYRAAFKEAIDRRRNRSVPDDRGEIEVIVLWGDTGTGKSRYCRESYPGAYWLHQPQNGTVWWDSYEYQETVVIDEFYGWIPFNFILRLLDRYSFRLPVKFGHRVCNVRRVVFTSNVSPDEWWPSADIPEEKRKAFRRRITTIKHFQRMPMLSHAVGDTP